MPMTKRVDFRCCPKAAPVVCNFSATAAKCLPRLIRPPLSRKFRRRKQAEAGGRASGSKTAQGQSVCRVVAGGSNWTSQRQYIQPRKVGGRQGRCTRGWTAAGPAEEGEEERTSSNSSPANRPAVFAVVLLCCCVLDAMRWSAHGGFAARIPLGRYIVRSAGLCPFEPRKTSVLHHLHHRQSGE